VASVASSIVCDVAVIGAGPGGAYVANRLSTHFASAKKICVFEQGSRVGGRIHSVRNSGPKKDLVVEAGAYRFATNITCEDQGGGHKWCIHTPLTKGIIMDYLKLKSRIYDPRPDMWDHKLNVIVNDEGNEIGYLTFVERLLSDVNATVPLYFGKKLVSIAPSGSDANSNPYTLNFGDGTTATAGSVVLNLPQIPLLRVLAHSKELMKSEAQVPEALHAPVAFPMMKMYVHYGDAWWINELGLRAGSFNNSAMWATDDASPHSSSMCMGSSQLPVPVQGSYHDGDIRCDGPNGECRGYIQAVYNGAPQAVRLFQQYHVMDDKGDSVQHLSAANSPEDARVLRRVHEALVEVHADALRAKGDGVLEKAKKAVPDSAILSIWDQRVAGIETGCHEPRTLRSTPSTVFPDDNGVDAARIPIDSLQPLVHSPGIFVANEAFGTLHCFAEASLVMAENVLHTGFGLPRPEWIDPEDYTQDIIFNTSTPTAATESQEARGWKAHPMGDLYFASSR